MDVKDLNINSVLNIIVRNKKEVLTDVIERCNLSRPKYINRLYLQFMDFGNKDLEVGPWQD
ncbi:hypothetical protein [Candidatus Hodgkinia cicadicola]|uniref:hypothetical protein n=1 Tax=Candidatus Hodgkinia cicadicola TaxID=573658 RepID=UPI0011BA8488